MNVSLTPKLVAYIRSQIASGSYSNASEVVRAALRVMQEREALHRAELRGIRRALIEGENSGPAREIDLEQLLDRFRVRRRRAA